MLAGGGGEMLQKVEGKKTPNIKDQYKRSWVMSGLGNSCSLAGYTSYREGKSCSVKLLIICIQRMHNCTCTKSKIGKERVENKIFPTNKGTRFMGPE